MMLAIVCAGLLGTLVEADTPPPSDSKLTYEQAKAQATRSPEDQVKLALWCEAHGLSAQRLHHLTLAVLADPTNALARGLMGLVAYNGRWLRPETVADRLKTDPDRLAALAEYETKRLHAAYTVDAQWALGVWADEHGLKEQARAHLTAVIRLDPSKENAWKRLGYKKHDGRWITEGQLAAEKAEAEAQKAADKFWRPRVDRSKGMLDNPSKREEAENALGEITDPRAVPAIVSAFVKDKDRPGDLLRGIQLLGQIESPQASRVLAGLAVLAKSADVRRVAIETLRRRDPRDFVKLWIALIHKPIKYEVKPVGGPGSVGTIQIEGDTAKLQRRYSPPSMPNVPIANGTTLSYDANGLPVLNEPIGSVPLTERVVWLPVYTDNASVIANAVRQAAQGGNIQQSLKADARAGHPAQVLTGYVPYALVNGELVPISNMNVNTSRATIEVEQDLRIPVGEIAAKYQKSAQTAQDQLQADVATLEGVNAAIRRSNEPALLALRTVTGQDFGDDPIAWTRWWTEVEGYVFAITQTADKPTIVEDVPLGYTPQVTTQVVEGLQIRIPQSHHACFAAGTTVRAIDGDRPIESIRAGDLILVQDTKTGSLGYQAVVTAFHNPPSPTLKIRLSGSETIVATGIHRFWKPGQGWTMARDLKVGDQVRTLGGVATVEAVTDDRVQPVFNLEVGDGHSFLVGKLGTLVHDNSLVEATLDPFDGVARASK